MIFLYAFLICFMCALLQGVVGFGFAVFAMFFLPMLMPLHLAAAVICVQTFVMGIFVAVKLRKSIDFKTAWLPMIFSVITVPIGIYFLMILEDYILEKILGVVFIAIAIVMGIRQNKEIKIKPSAKNGIIYGTFSGVISGMFNAGGPPLVLYYLYAIPSSIAYKATIEFSFVLRSLSTIISHWSIGNYSGQIVLISLIGSIATVLGSIIGLKLFAKVPRGLLQKLTYGMMTVMGIVLIV